MPALAAKTLSKKYIDKTDMENSYLKIQDNWQQQLEFHKEKNSCSTFLFGNVQNVIATDESVAVFFLQLSINVFFGLF